MRSPTRARWLICAIALCSMSPSVLADGKAKKKKKEKRNVDDCTSFAQLDREDEDGVDLSIHSTCDVKLSCGIKWTLVCNPESRKAKKSREAVAFQLEYDTSDGATASTASCGLHGWEITDITWSCEPAQ